MKGRLVNLYYSFTNNEMFLVWVLRTATGKIMVDTPCFDLPYFYASAGKWNEIKELMKDELNLIPQSTVIDKQKFFAFQHDDTPIKVFMKYPSDLTKIRKFLSDDDLHYHIHLTDVAHPLRILMDNDIGIFVDIDEESLRYKNVYEDYKKKNIPHHKAIWFDIESDDTVYKGQEEMSIPERGKYNKIISIAYADYHDKEIKFICHDDEVDTLKEFRKILYQYDHVLDWNGDSYDKPVLDARLKANDLSHIDWRDFQHIDYMRLFIQRHRLYVNRWFLSLEAAGETHVGMGKIPRKMGYLEMFETARDELETYNKRDIEIMIKLEEQFNFYNIQCNIAKIMGSPIEAAKFPLWLVEGIMLRASKDCVWPDKPTDADKKLRKSFKGASQFTTPGVYFNNAILDWRSLYNRIMQTFGISGEAYNPQTGRFDRFDTNVISPIAPKLLVEMENERDIYTSLRKQSTTQVDYQRYDEMQAAIKVIILLFWGVVGSKHSRFFHRDVAGQIAYWGRALLKGDGDLKGIVEITEELNLKAVYGHTDSVAITMGKGITRDELFERASHLQLVINDNINSFLEKYGIPKYQRKIQMEIQGLYYSLFLPNEMARHAELEMYDPDRDKWHDPYKLTVKGFEMVKSDREMFTREFQESLLMKILYGESIEDLLLMIKEIKRNFIKGEYNDLLIIHSNTKPLKTYKNRPPHITVAYKLKEMGLFSEGQTVDYVYTKRIKNKTNPEPVINGMIPEILPSGLAHYWNNRIYGWLSSIMEIIMDKNDFDAEVGKIICHGETILPPQKRLDQWFG